MIPSPDHCQYYRFWLPDTRVFCTAQIAKLFPAYCNIPINNNPQDTQTIAKDLVKAFLHNKNLHLNIKPTHKQALTEISEVFNDASKPLRVEVNTQKTRVYKNTHTDSSDTIAARK